MRVQCCAGSNFALFCLDTSGLSARIFAQPQSSSAFANPRRYGRSGGRSPVENCAGRVVRYVLPATKLLALLEGCMQPAQEPRRQEHRVRGAYILRTSDVSTGRPTAE